MIPLIDKLHADQKTKLSQKNVLITYLKKEQEKGKEFWSQILHHSKNT